MVDTIGMYLGSPYQRVLHDAGIVEAIQRNTISISPDPTLDQIQPGSLDVRIGKVRVYDKVAMRKGIEWSNAHPGEEPTTQFAQVIPNEKDAEIIIPPGAFTELFFHEEIMWNTKMYDTEFDLRSSRGRLGLRLNNQFIEQEDGERYVALRNYNPNPIKLYGQSKFGQMFFYPRSHEVAHNGYLIDDSDVACAITQSVCEYMPGMVGPLIAFTVGDHVLKYKEHIGTIDVNNKPKDMLEKIDTKEGVILTPQECAIVQLHPKLDLPANVGIQFLPQLPFAQRSLHISPDPMIGTLEQYAVNAGWVDPGYQGYVTSHPIRRKFPTTLTKGMPIALGRIYYYTSNVMRPYGSEELGSHYQGSIGVGSRS